MSMVKPRQWTRPKPSDRSRWLRRTKHLDNVRRKNRLILQQRLRCTVGNGRDENPLTRIDAWKVA